MGQILDLTGQRFGRLTVLSYSHSKNAAFWKCQCDCGNATVVRGALLRDGSVASCGCGSLEACIRNAKKYVDSIRSPYPYSRKLKDLRGNMIKRCTNPADSHWQYYGGKGVRLCREWMNDSRTFYKWATENGYEPGLQIDRINVDGNYEPRNCRFVPIIIQANNRTDNRYLTWKGKKLSISDWAREIGVRSGAINHRVQRGWSVHRIFTQPFRRSPTTKKTASRKYEVV